ncbi:MAG TPA: Rrf2 family transcriptional regulator [Acidimicrobiia bacterium]|jgi:Rrf2 family protein
MRLSEGVEWGIHCATLLAVVPPDRTLSAARLAEYHGVAGPYLAKHLQALVRGGVLESVPGPRGGFRLARAAGEITMLDVVEAIDGDVPSFTCTEIRRRGPTRLPAREYRVPCSIHVVMDRADAAWRAELAAVSIADLVGEVMTGAPPRAIEKGIEWMQEVLT